MLPQTEGDAVISTNQESEDKMAEDPSKGGARVKRTEALKTASDRVKYDAGVSWMHTLFSSAKDPSWEERHPIEPDDDFVVHYAGAGETVLICPSHRKRIGRAR